MQGLPDAFPTDVSRLEILFPGLPSNLSFGVLSALMA
jgi:hypothetical protein